MYSCRIPMVNSWDWNDFCCCHNLCKISLPSCKISNNPFWQHCLAMTPIDVERRDCRRGYFSSVYQAHSWLWIYHCGAAWLMLMMLMIDCTSWSCAFVTHRTLDRQLYQMDTQIPTIVIIIEQMLKHPNHAAVSISAFKSQRPQFKSMANSNTVDDNANVCRVIGGNCWLNILHEYFTGTILPEFVASPWIYTIDAMIL